MTRWAAVGGEDWIPFPTTFLMSSTFLPSVLSILLPPFCFPDLGIIFPLQTAALRFLCFWHFFLSRWTPWLASSAFPGWLVRLSPNWSGGHHLGCCALSSKAKKALIQYSGVMKMPGVLFFFFFLKFRIHSNPYLPLLWLFSDLYMVLQVIERDMEGILPSSEQACVILCHLF